MLLCCFLFLLIGYNLFHVISDNQTVFYKDVRFWLVLFSLVVLLWLTVQSYPV